MILAAVGLCVSGYLAWLSLTGQTAPGCGAGAGCGEVLGSRWSAIGPVPVSVLAAGGYLVILALLAFQPWRTRSRDLWLGVLGGLGVALLGAAAWFIVLQARVIDAWCPYCMGGHGVGILLGALLFIPTVRRRSQWPVAVVLGLVLAGSLIGLQVALPASGYQVSLSNEGDYDQTDATGRHLGLLNGKLRLDAADTPHHGPTDGGTPIVLLLDYACPHCREAHEMLAEQLEAREGLVVFALPVSLHEDHNPHIPLDHERFDHSYELALLSLAVWREAPEEWPAYDRWLFEGSRQTGDVYGWPRTLAAAEAEAADLIGRAAVGGAYSDANLIAQVDRNIAAIGDVLAMSPGAMPGLPIVMAPHASGAMYGRFDEVGLLEMLLEDAEAGR